MGCFLVVGASSGIGRAIAKDLLHKDHVVVGLARRMDKLQEIDGLVPVKGDVRILEDVQRSVEISCDPHGVLDGVFYVAGAGSIAPFHKTPMENLLSVVETGTAGLIHVVRETLPSLIESRGVLCIVSSPSAHLPIPMLAAYCATKSFQAALGAALRLEMIPYRVSVVVCKPGFVRTGIWDSSYGNPHWLRIGKSLGISPENAARGIISKALSNRRSCRTGG